MRRRSASGWSPTATTRRGRASADVAVLSTCCVTNEAVAKSRKAAARAARRHARVYVTGCGANLGTDAFAGLPSNVVVVARPAEDTARFVAGDVGAVACVNDEARLDRVRAFVKIQDGCSFSCAFCVIPLVRGASRSRSADAVLAEIRKRVAQGHREVVLTGINLGCFRDRARRPHARDARACGRCHAGPRAPASELDRDQPRRREADRGAARDADGFAPPSRPVAVRRRRRSPRDGAPLYGRRPISGGSSRSRPSYNLTSDVIVGFPTEDRRCVRPHAADGRARRAHEGARLPVLAAPGDGDRRRRRSPAPRQEGARRASACAQPRASGPAVAREGRKRRRRPRRPARSRVRRRLHAVPRRRAGGRSSCRCAPKP